MSIVLLVALGAPAHAQEIPIPDGCPPSHTSKSTDGNGDLKPDWKLHTQNDTANGTLELWCIDPNGTPGNGTPGNPYDEFYALVYVAADGTRFFIGKCPFGGGINDGDKNHTAAGAMSNITWNSTDGGADDDGDGSQDDVHYTFNTTTRKLPVEQTQNGTVVSNRTIDPVTGRFNFTDLPPRDPHNPNFWAMVEGGEHGGMPGDLVDGPDVMWEYAALRVRAVYSGSGDPAEGLDVTVIGPMGFSESLVTDAAGEAWFSPPAGESYTVSVEGADPVTVPLSAPTTIAVGVTGPPLHMSSSPLPAVGIGVALAAIALAGAAVAFSRRRT